MRIEFSLRSGKTITGTVKDLSDNGRYLVLAKPENGILHSAFIGKIKRFFQIKNRKKETYVPLEEIEVIRIIDRSLKE